MSSCLHGPTSGRAFEDYLGHVGIEPGGATAVVLGQTQDASFPVTVGTLDTVYSGATDGFLARVSLSTGQILAATFVGGSFMDDPTGLALSPSGTVFVAAHTESPDFPMSPTGYDTSYSALGDVGVIELDGNFAGAGPGIPLHGTFLGTPGDEDGARLALSPNGTVLLAGSTNHPGFPTTLGAWDTVFNGAPALDDGFLSCFDPTLMSLIYSTFIGGDGLDLCLALAPDGNDAAVVAGGTFSDNFPTRAGSYDTTFNGLADGFLARLDTRLCPILQVLPDPLVRGQAATFRVSELILGERAFLLYGRSGTGFANASAQLGGLNLDLAGAISLLSQTGPASAGGIATFGVTVPVSVPPSQIWFQAAVKRGTNASHSLKTNVVQRVIQ